MRNVPSLGVTLFTSLERLEAGAIDAGAGLG
jgi:hypothetical protein